MRNMRCWMAIVGLALAAACADGWAVESFQQRLAKANAALDKGDVDAALEQYRDLQTDEPESEILYYNTGCAHYKKAQQAKGDKPDQGAIATAQGEAPKQEALDAFKEAKSLFGKVQNARDPNIRKKAAFNLANVDANVAELSLGAQKPEETEEAFKNCIREYEEIVKKDPEHAKAAQGNLEHIRALLKELIQKQKEQQQQQQQQGGQGKNDDKQKDDQKQDQKDQQGQDQQKQDENKDQNKSDQDKKEQPSQGEKKDQPEAGKEEQKENKEEKAQEAAELKDQKDQKDQQEAQDQSKDEAKPDDKQNVEALLQSLEDTDHREQREKNPRTEIKMKKEWW